MVKTYKEFEADIFRDTTPGVSGPADQTFTSTTVGGYSTNRIFKNY